LVVYTGIMSEITVTPDVALKEAARQLREKLAAAEEEEARTHERAESLRIAIREVEALGGSAPLPPAPAGTPTGVRRSLPRSTVSAAILDLLSWDPRPWNAMEIISALELSGRLAHLNKLSHSVRCELGRMVKRGEIARVGRGYYQYNA
jgi:hypothetical protein